MTSEPRRSGTWALLRQRCPRCRTAPIFRGTIEMNTNCPNCGLLFHRAEGYFLGAMYASYALSVLVLAAFYFTASAFFPNWHSALVALIAVILYLPFVPMIFRYSRTIWIYFDRWADPHGQLSESYEKRQQQPPTQSPS